MANIDNVLKHCVSAAESYRVEKDADYYRIIMHITTVPGHTIPVTFDYLTRTDLTNNGFEVPT